MMSTSKYAMGEMQKAQNRDEETKVTHGSRTERRMNCKDSCQGKLGTPSLMELVIKGLFIYGYWFITALME